MKFLQHFSEKTSVLQRDFFFHVGEIYVRLLLYDIITVTVRYYHLLYDIITVTLRYYHRKSTILSLLLYDIITVTLRYYHCYSMILSVLLYNLVKVSLRSVLVTIQTLLVQLWSQIRWPPIHIVLQQIHLIIE